MSHDDLEPFIEEYIEKTRNALPEGFDTEDFLENLRMHITDLLREKKQKRPAEDSKVLLEEVFDELGSPEKAKEKVLTLQVDYPPQSEKRSPEFILAVRGVVSGAVVIIASIIMHYTVNWDFLTTLILLSIIVVIEWIPKAWKMRKLTRNSKS
jgi:hypothetical protein